MILKFSTGTPAGVWRSGASSMMLPVIVSSFCGVVTSGRGLLGGRRGLLGRLRLFRLGALGSMRQ